MIPLQWFGRHPRPARLHRFVDGELREPDLSRLRSHLAGCARCRERVSFFQSLRETARRIPAPSPPPELLADVLASREAGERVILPTEPAPARPTAPLRVLAAAAVLVLAAGVSLIFVSKAGAGASDLQFLPIRPEPGNELRVEYRPASLLADEPALTARARYRVAGHGAASDPSKRLLAVGLRREDDGFYRGSFRLPPSAVYATFAVEDLTGERVDANGNRLWELLVHAGEDRPLLEALTAQYDDLEDRNWLAATETARRTADLYPDRVEGWSMLLEHEVRVLEGADLETRLEEHRELFHRLQTPSLRSPDLSASELAALNRYARLLGDREAEDRFAGMLQERYPSHPAAIQTRLLSEIAQESDARRKLELLEAEWRRSGPAADVVPDVGFTIAESLGDAQAMLRWAERLSRTGIEGAADAAAALATAPSLRGVGIQHLSEVIERIGKRPDEERGLSESRSEFRKRNEAWVRSLQGLLARALVEAGRLDEGRDLLAIAAAQGWDPEVFGTAAEVRLAAGDTSEALILAARVAVDPLSSPESVTRLRSRLGAGAQGSSWDDLLSRARLELGERVETGALPARPFPGGIMVRSADGRLEDLGQLFGGRTTVVAFWHRHSWPFLHDLDDLGSLAGAYEGRELQLLTVSVEPPGTGVDQFLQRHQMVAPVFFDAQDAAARDLGVWGTPEYLVIDRAGRIRLRSADLGAAARVAEALKQESPPAG